MLGLVLIWAQECCSSGVDDFVTDSKGELAENKVPLSLCWSCFQMLLHTFRMGLPASINLIKKTPHGSSQWLFLSWVLFSIVWDSNIIHYSPFLFVPPTIPMVLLSLFQINHLIFFRWLPISLEKWFSNTKQLRTFMRTILNMRRKNVKVNVFFKKKLVVFYCIMNTNKGQQKSIKCFFNYRLLKF